MNATPEGRGMEALDGAALVCRGGGCSIGEFLADRSIKIAGDGTLSRVSTQVGTNPQLMMSRLPARFTKAGFTTVAEIRDAGGILTKTGSAGHWEISNLSAAKLESLFTKVIDKSAW